MPSTALARLRMLSRALQASTDIRGFCDSSRAAEVVKEVVSRRASHMGSWNFMRAWYSQGTASGYFFWTAASTARGKALYQPQEVLHQAQQTELKQKLESQLEELRQKLESQHNQLL